MAAAAAAIPRHRHRNRTMEPGRLAAVAVSAQERPPGAWARVRTPSRVPRKTFPTSTARATSGPAAGPRKPGRRGGACAWTGARSIPKPSRGPWACFSSSAELSSPVSWCPWAFIVSSGAPNPKNRRERPKAERCGRPLAEYISY